MGMVVSNELENWANIAEFSLTRDAEDGQVDIFWNRGGEVRYFVREKPDGWVEISCSDRLGPEYFIFTGASATIVERFLLGWFGDSYRSIKRMPIIATPISSDGLMNGYRIASQIFDGVDRYVLIDPADRVIAASSGGRIMAPGRLAPLSVFLHVTLDEIEQSFRSEDGKPLFGIRA
jgi:hypothetical protein